MLCVDQFFVGLGYLMCAVWDSLLWVWGSEFAASGFVCICVCVCVFRHCVFVSRQK